MFTINSEKKVWWICSKGHEWEAYISNRASKNVGCPYCAGKKVLKGFNDLETLCPDVAQEWNYDKNDNLRYGGNVRKDMIMNLQLIIELPQNKDALIVEIKKYFQDSMI